MRAFQMPGCGFSINVDKSTTSTHFTFLALPFLTGNFEHDYEGV